MKFQDIIRLFLIGICINSGNYFVVSGLDNQSIDIPPKDSINFSSRNHRFRRSSSDESLTTSLDRLKMVARVTNGIYLQQGLIAGTIPSDVLISELLYFGSVTPSQIAAMNTTKIEEAIKTLKTLPSTLEPNKDISEVEAAFKGLEEILKAIDGIGDISKWNDEKEKFKQEIQKLANTEIDLSAVKTLYFSANRWHTEYSALEQNHANLAAAELKDAFKILAKALKVIKSAKGTITEAVPVWKFENFNSALHGLSPIIKASKGVEIFRTLSSKFSIVPDKEAAYSNHIGTLVQTLKPIKESNFKDAKELVMSRKVRSRSRELSQTFGFPDGISDMSDLFPDLKSSWLKNVLKTDSLAVALNHLTGLEGLLKKVDTALGTKRDESIEKIKNLFVIIDGLNDLASKSEEVKNGIPDIQKCDVIGAKQLPLNITVIQQKLGEIDQKLANIDSLIEQLLHVLNTDGIDEMCETLMKVCEEAENSPDVKQVVQKFQNHENLKALNTHIDSIRDLVTKIADVQKVSTIKQEAVNATLEFANLDNYHTNLTAHYGSYFKCLQDQIGLKTVFKAIAKIDKVRALKDNQEYLDWLDNWDTVVKEIVSTSGNLKNVKKEISGMKGLKSPETDALKGFKDASKHSNVVGLSVQGISNMKNAMDKKTVVKEVTDNMNEIRKSMSYLKEPEDVENLKKLIALEDDIKKMYDSLDIFKKTVSNSESTILADYSSIFQKAKPVTGINKDLKAIIATLKTLIEKVPMKDPLKKIESALQTMDTMGLEFSKYTKVFDNSKGSLAALDLFFASNSKKNPTGSGTQGKPNGNQGKQTLANTGTPTGDKPQETNITEVLMYVFAGISGLLCLAASFCGIFCGFQYYRFRKQDPIKKRDSIHRTQHYS